MAAVPEPLPEKHDNRNDYAFNCYKMKKLTGIKWGDDINADYSKISIKKIDRSAVSPTTIRPFDRLQVI